jgi:hypothetical protein
VLAINRRNPPIAETMDGICGDDQLSQRINNNNLPSGAAQRPNQPTQAEIEFRHGRGRRQCGPTINGLRLRELRITREKLYGETIPPTPMGRTLCRDIALHLSYGIDPVRRIRGVLSDVAAWMTAGEVQTIIDAMMAVDDDTGRRLERYPTADQLGWRLQITRKQREEWGLTTIGAMKDSSVKRRARRKARNKAAKAAARLAAGAKPHSESAVRTRPWELVGMTERTWYRHRKPVPPRRSAAASVKRRIRNLAEIRVQRFSYVVSPKHCQTAAGAKDGAKNLANARRGLPQCTPDISFRDLRSKRVAFADRPAYLTAPRITADDVPRLRAEQT